MPAPVLAMVNSAAFPPAQTHRHPALRLVVFDGVVGEVQQQLAQPMPVAAHSDFLAGGQFDLNALRLGENLRVGKLSRTSSSSRTGSSFSATWPASALASSVRPSTMRARRRNSSKLAGGAFALGGGKRFVAQGGFRSPHKMVSGVLSSCEACSVNSRMRLNESSSRAAWR
jgi:hypothetical protein